MGVWNKIWNGIKTFGTALISGLTTAAEGAVMGSAAGPIGTMVGAIGGALVGLLPNMPKIVDFVNNPDGSGDTTDVSQILSRPADQVNTAISMAVADPSAPGSKVILDTLQGIQMGGTWRSSFAAAGGNQFNSAIVNGGIQSLANKAAVQIGVPPSFALMHGNGAFRSLVPRAGQSTTMYHSLGDHVLGATYPISAAALAPMYAPRAGSQLQSASTGISM